MDFNSEVNDNLAALDYLLNRNDVDKDNVFVFGHSTGGIVVDNSNVTLKAIPNLDHAYARDKKESFMNYKTRNFKKNQEVFNEITAWMDLNIRRLI